MAAQDSHASAPEPAVGAALGTAVDRLATAWALAAGCLLLVITLVTAWNAVAFMLDRLAAPLVGSVPGLPGFEDFVRLVISCAALMVLPYGQLRQGHVAVDVFVTRFPVGVRSALARLSLLGTTAAAVFLGYWMILGMLETRADGATSRILGWPEWPFYLPGILSMGLWAVVAMRQMRSVGGDSAVFNRAADGA